MQHRLMGAALAALLFAMPAVAHADWFGAIAYNPGSGAYGYSIDYPDRYGAENRALYECGGGCRVAVWFRNACGALAVGYNGGWGSGWGSSRQRGEYEAINACSRYTSNCAIRAWACTRR